MSLPTLEEIERAYAEIRAVPVRCGWAGYVAGPGTRCACPMAALLAVRDGFDQALSLEEMSMGDDEEPSPEGMVASALGLTERQVRGFEVGFDAGPRGWFESGLDREAFDLGVAARDKFQPPMFLDVT